MIRGETIKPMSITELIAVISLFIAMTSFLFNLGIFETVRTRKGLDVQAFKPISLIIGVTYITFPIVGIVIKKQVTTTHMEKITLLTLYNVFIFIVLYIIYITFNKKFVAKKKQIFESNDVYVPSKKESDIYFVCSMLLISIFPLVNFLIYEKAIVKSIGAFRNIRLIPDVLFFYMTIFLVYVTTLLLSGSLYNYSNLSKFKKYKIVPNNELKEALKKLDTRIVDKKYIEAYVFIESGETLKIKIDTKPYLTIDINKKDVVLMALIKRTVPDT